MEEITFDLAAVERVLAVEPISVLESDGFCRKASATGSNPVHSSVTKTIVNIQTKNKPVKVLSSLPSSSSDYTSPGTDGDGLSLLQFNEHNYEAVHAYNLCDTISTVSSLQSPNLKQQLQNQYLPSQEVLNKHQHKVADCDYEYEYALSQGYVDSKLNDATMSEKLSFWNKELRSYGQTSLVNDENDKNKQKNVNTILQLENTKKLKSYWKKSAKSAFELKKWRSNDYVSWQAKDAKLYLAASSSGMGSLETVQPPLTKSRSRKVRSKSGDLTAIKQLDGTFKSNNIEGEGENSTSKDKGLPKMQNPSIKKGILEAKNVGNDSQNQNNSYFANKEILPKGTKLKTKATNTNSTIKTSDETIIEVSYLGKREGNRMQNTKISEGSNFENVSEVLPSSRSSLEWKSKLKGYVSELFEKKFERNILSESECAQILGLIPGADTNVEEPAVGDKHQHPAKLEKTRHKISNSNKKKKGSTLQAIGLLVKYETTRLANKEIEHIKRIQEIEAELNVIQQANIKNRKEQLNNPESSTGGEQLESLRKPVQRTKRNFLGGVVAERSANAVAKVSLAQKRKKENKLLVNMYGKYKKHSDEDREGNLEKFWANTKFKEQLLGALLRKLRKKLVFNILRMHVKVGKILRMLLLHREGLLQKHSLVVSFKAFQLNHMSKSWLRLRVKKRQEERKQRLLQNVYLKWKQLTQEQIELRGKMLTSVLHHEQMVKWKVTSIWRVSIFMRYYEVSTTACMLQWRRVTVLGLHFFAWASRAKYSSLLKSRLRATLDPSVSDSERCEKSAGFVYKLMREIRKQKYCQYGELYRNLEQCGRILTQCTSFGIRDDNIAAYVKGTKKLYNDETAVSIELVPHGYSHARRAFSHNSWMLLGRSKTSAEVKRRFGSEAFSLRLQARHLALPGVSAYSFRRILVLLRKHLRNRSLVYGCRDSNPPLAIVPFQSAINLTIKAFASKSISFEGDVNNSKLNVIDTAVIYANRKICMYCFDVLREALYCRRARHHRSNVLKVYSFGKWQDYLYFRQKLLACAEKEGTRWTLKNCIRTWKAHILHWRFRAIRGYFSPWNRWKRLTRCNKAIRKLGEANICKYALHRWKCTIKSKKLLVRVFSIYERFALRRERIKKDPFARQFNLLLDCIIQWRENLMKIKSQRLEEEKEIVADMFYAQTVLRKHFKKLAGIVCTQPIKTKAKAIVSEFEFGIPVWTNPSPSSN